jgi:hypothetical protein
MTKSAAVIYILAGDTIGITIFGKGHWEFDDDTEA